jgi:hypothetical protein
MGKVISIKQGRRRHTATVVNGEANPFLFDDTFLVEEGEPEETIDNDLYKRIAYDLMEDEVSEPLVKPMWPLSSTF